VSPAVVEFARAGNGVAVKAGAPIPDIDNSLQNVCWLRQRIRKSAGQRRFWQTYSGISVWEP